MLRNQIVPVSLIKTCHLPSFPLFFTETVKSGVFIQNHMQNGKGWKEKNPFIYQIQ